MNTGRPTEKIRVMRLFSRLNIGGPSVHVVLLTQRLEPSRYQTSLIVGEEEEREGNFHDLARSKGVAPLVLPTLGRSIRPLDDLRSLVSLCRLMARERPHVVHTHTAKAGALGRVAAFLTGVPVVVHTFHGTVFAGYFGPLASRTYAVAERCLARITDAIIGVSPAVTAELIRQGVRPRHGIHTIPLGLELERFATDGRNGQLRQRLGIGRDVKLIGCVGRLVPIKDLPTLLSALASIADAHLALIGDGPERGRLEALVRERGLSHRVHFTGFISELEHAYPDLDVVVNSSRNEGTPVALIEAMAAGVPVVATAVGGSPDLLQDGALGTLVPANDPRALARAITDILLRPDGARTRAIEAQRSVIERYRWQRLVGELDDIYAKLLHTKGISSAPDLAPART